MEMKEECKRTRERGHWGTSRESIKRDKKPGQGRWQKGGKERETKQTKDKKGAVLCMIKNMEGEVE